MSVQPLKSYTKLAAAIIVAAVIVSLAILSSSASGTTSTSTFTSTSTITFTATSIGAVTTETTVQTTTVTVGDYSCQAMGVAAGLQITAANSTGGNSTLNWWFSSGRYFAYPQELFINGTTTLFSFGAAAAYPGIGIAGYFPIPNGISIIKGHEYDMTVLFYIEPHFCIIDQDVEAY